jgi:UDP:flavonoid glycosyltransferase YjiC (YdhE family)
MKPTVLIIPASIRSHVMPSLFIADLLADDYEVHYAVTNNILKEIVVRNGYQAFTNSGYRPFIGIEGRFLQDVKKKKLLSGISQKPFGKMKFTNTEKLNLMVSLNELNLKS